MSWEDIIKMKNRWGERVGRSDQEWLFKILDKFMADDAYLDLSIANAVSSTLHNYFEEGSEIMNQVKELQEAIDFAENQSKELQMLLKEKYVGKGNLLKE